MCRKLILLCLLSALISSSASATQYAYRVNFSNKNGTLAFSDSLSFLSPRAMARRDMQGIVLDSTDLPVTAAYVDSVLTLTGGKLHEVSKWMNLCVILINDSTQIHALDGKAFVSSVKLVGYYATSLHRQGNTTHTLTAGKTTSGGSSYFGYTWDQTMLVNGNYLSDNGYTGNGKLIAVIDAGFWYTDTHPGFDSLRAGGIVDVHNFTLDTSFVYAYDTHGTSVLSTMAGNVPTAFVGSAPHAQYALYVSEDDNSEQPIELLNMLCAAERADSLGADIITTSLGYDTFDDPTNDFVFATDFDGKTTVAARAANMATQKGMLFVASAGNEGGGSWNSILTPGDADSALTIGSVDITGTNAPTSGFGPNAAGQIKPDVCGLGHYAYIFTESGYAVEDGTSFSTPQIAGWAACLWESTPTAGPARIRRAIIQCANHFSDPGTQIGYGIPDLGCSKTIINTLDTPLPLTNNLVISVSNPAYSILSITVTVPEYQNIDFSMLDMTGREVARFTHTFDKGMNTPVQYDIAVMPAGMYLLKAVSATHQQTIKVVKE